MNAAAKMLVDTAKRGELHHAIIVFGPSADPLRELSVTLAKTLECLNATTGDDCNACQKIDKRIHPDVHFVEVGGEKKLISVEQIRDIVGEATLRPYEGRSKVFVIDPADAISPSGANAMLKTLEEPPRDTHFVLLTRSPDLLLPTIKSRCQHIYVGDDRPNRSRLEQIAVFEAGDLAKQVTSALERFATKRDSTALLALAAIVSSYDDVKDAIALTAAVMTSGDARLDAIPRERLLASADAMLAAIRALTVNADARLVVEQALAELVIG
jgi:DNA polymerase III gamma/tau subunit